MNPQNLRRPMPVEARIIDGQAAARNAGGCALQRALTEEAGQRDHDHKSHGAPPDPLKGPRAPLEFEVLPDIDVAVPMNPQSRSLP